MNEVKEYTKKAWFFSVFAKLLSDKGIKVRIESKCKQNNGNECRPDFHCQADNQKVIFEHKGSVSKDETFIASEIENTERYLDLKPRDAVNEVILLFPNSGINRVTEVIRKIKTEVIIWGYQLNMDRTELTLNQYHNMLKSSVYQWIIENQLKFHMTWCSIHRFLRDPPPTIYTASFILNDVLRSFIDPWRAATESFHVDLDLVVSRAQMFFPQTPDSNQITQKRVVEALEFLNTIEWVDYPDADNGVTVIRTRRIREELISEALCKEFCRIKEGEQSSLEDFMQ
jgi:hypothetical protein